MRSTLTVNSNDPALDVCIVLYGQRYWSTIARVTRYCRGRGLTVILTLNITHSR